MSHNDRATCRACEGTGLERTRFFQRQLVTADDLTQDQDYFRARLRRHNRLLHGWGVVCGARCRGGPNTGEVIIEPGFLLGPQGDEIAIEREVTLNISSQDLDGHAAASTGGPADPWCSAVRIDRRPGDRLYLAVRYTEYPTRPVRAPTAGSGSDAQACEYSRLGDGYAFRLLTRLPAGYADPMPVADPSTAWRCTGGTPACSPCPSEPWVVLADITVGSEGKVAKLDCYAHRRHVVSFADVYFTCATQAGPPHVASVKIMFADGSELVFPPAPVEEDAGIGLGPVLKVADTPAAIEVVFAGGDVDPNTVTKETFVVQGLSPTPPAIELASTVAPSADARTFRWVPDAGAILPGLQVFLLTLRGSPPLPAIASLTGLTLDGELGANGLPSGDGTPGGDFTLVIRVAP
jgi:hypothetical protein